VNKYTKQVLFWTPRILSMLFAVFLGVFALDVFSEGYALWETIAAFLIHLIPSFVVLLVLAAAWQWEWIGAILFIAFAVFYVADTWESFSLVAYLAISGPLVVAGILFLLNWIYRAQLRTR
jgi:hypothetical protein